AAFFTSSFLGGVSGAILAFAYYRAVTPEQFSFNVSIQLVAMVLVGGLGSAIGSFLGAGFVLLGPIFLTNLVAGLAAGGWINISANMIAHVPLMIYGASSSASCCSSRWASPRSTTTFANTSWSGPSAIPEVEKPQARNGESKRRKCR